MRYSLYVTLNYPNKEKELAHRELTEGELMSHLQAYICRPNITSIIFTVTRGLGVSDIPASFKTNMTVPRRR